MYRGQSRLVLLGRAGPGFRLLSRSERMKKLAIKKTRERKQLESFRRNCRDFPQGRIQSFERPDFLIRQSLGKNKRIIGIEITEFYQPTTKGSVPRQARENVIREILQRAKLLHKTRGGPTLYVTAFFDKQTQLRMRQINGIAEKLTNIICDHPLKVGETTELHNPFDGSMDFPRAVDLLSIRRYASAKRALWYAPDSGFIPQMPIDALQELLNRKDKLLPVYRQHCDDVWLLIAYGFSVSSWFERTREGLDHIYASRFDRVYLLETFEGVTNELTVKAELSAEID